MRHTVWIVCLFLACPKPPAAEDASVPVEAMAAPDAGWLTLAQLDQWLAYQRGLLALTPLSRGDGGPAFLRADVRRRARAEAEARADAGLSVDQVERIEAVVAAVVTERALGRLRGTDGTARFADVLDELTPAQREKAEKAFRALGPERPGGSLEAIEAEFGAAAVQTVLTREAEVTKTWDALLEARGDSR